MSIINWLVIFLFAVSAFAETTNQQRRNNFHANRHARNQEQAQMCLDFENRLRNQILSTMDEGMQDMQTLQACFDNSPKPANHPCNTSMREQRDHMWNSLQAYRNATETMYSNIATNWIEGLDGAQREVAERCFLTQGTTAAPDGSIVRPGTVQFDGHLRTLRAQISDPTLCVGARNAYGAELSQAAANALQNPSQYGLSGGDVSTIQNFRESLLKRMMSDRTKYDPNLSEADLRASLHGDLARANEGMRQLRERIQHLSDGELYKVYDFGSQYQAFLEGLPEGERSSAESCQSSSGFIGSCLGSGPASHIEGRCGSNAWGIARDLLPVIGMVDAMSQYQETLAAEASGAITRAEADARNASSTVQFLMGIPIGGLMGAGAGTGIRALAREGAEEVAESGVRREVAGAGSRNFVDMRNLSAADRTRILTRNAGLDNSGRVAEAGRVVGRDLSPAQQAAVLRAHEVGAERGFGTYTRADLREKFRLLQEAGFSRDEIDQLMRQGVTGRYARSIDADHTTYAEFLREQGIEPAFGRSTFNSIQATDRVPLGQLDTFGAANLGDDLSAAGYRNLRGGNITQAAENFEASSDAMVAAARRRVAAEGENVDTSRLDPIMLRAFAYQNAGRQGSRRQLGDDMVRAAVETNYFSRYQLPDAASVTRIYDPQRNDEIRRMISGIGGNQFNNLGRDPEQAYFYLNRMANELEAVIMARGAGRTISDQLPQGLREISTQDLSRMRQEYQRALGHMETHYFSELGN